MKKSYTLLVFLISMILFSCSVRKAEVKKKEQNVEVKSGSNEEEKVTADITTKTSTEESSSTDGTIKTKIETITPIDSTKPTELTLSSGEKIIVKNGKYTKEEKVETLKTGQVKSEKKEENNKLNYNKNYKSNSDIKAKLKEKDKAVDSKSFFGWKFILPLIVILLSFYVVYRTSSFSRIIDFFKKT